MNRRSFYYLFAIMAGLSLVLYSIALMPAFLQPSKPLVLSPGQIRGMALISQGSYYTLNFEQQNQIVQAINGYVDMQMAQQKMPSQKDRIPALQTGAPAAEKLVIYFFDKPEWTIPLKED